MRQYVSISQPEPDEGGFNFTLRRSGSEAHGWIGPCQHIKHCIFHSPFKTTCLITYETAILRRPGRPVLPESLEEDLEHHDEEGGEEGVVDDIEEGDLS